MNSPKYGDRTAILKRNRHWQSLDGQVEIDQCEDEANDSSSQILDRVKLDRVAVTQPEEDRRRRTIIVEKSNGSFGFTLQSYGIHYKREQEIEMITYVDFVDYDGPAYRAGMREGDVILSINGHDMEKTDHKTLVNFIKKCDSRMRMVVLFEDCVRKVELHMRYIQVQRALRNKMLELERLCLKERELLEGKWKTHSLPARKKATSNSHSSTDGALPHQHSTTTDYTYCRPTVSTEDVAKMHPQVVLAYQYMDPQYRAYLLQGKSVASTVGSTNSGEYLLSWKSQQSQRQEQHKHQMSLKSCTKHGQGCRTVHVMAAALAEEQPTSGTRKSQHFTQKHRHLCPPCIRASNQGDNGSLDAYDLASPCCDSRCVPTRRKSSHKQPSDGKEKSSKDSKKTSGRSSHQQLQPHHYHQHQKEQQQQRYTASGSGLVSQCSLHSCASNWSDHAGTASNATSLSTDTLYWDDSSQTQPLESYTTNSYQIYNPVKPKSWDNLATKAVGGYGFGYGYLESNHRSGSQKSHTGRGHSSKIRIEGGFLEEICGPQYYIITRPSVGKNSSESLLGRNDSSSLSCECLESATPAGTRIYFTADKSSKQVYLQQQHVVQYDVHHRKSTQPPQPKLDHSQQQLRDTASQTDGKTAQGEVTRL